MHIIHHSHVRIIGAAILLLSLVATVVQPTSLRAQTANDITITAADGTVEVIDAIDPPNRTAGLLALYTPDFGTSTRTNQFGAEAILIETDTLNEYRVTDVCTVFDNCPNPGDNPIPENGAVLSAAPEGDPDVRLFIRNHIAVDDIVTITVPTRREVSRTLDAIDPTPENNPDGVDPGTGQCFPGCRGASQFILYTPDFGERTGTNDFGFEVAVVDGRVVSRGGNNSAIPEGGFILSGHGGVGSWLSANTILGAIVDVNELEVTIVIDSSSYIFTAQTVIDTAQNAFATAQDVCLAVPFDQAETAIGEAETLLTEAQEALENGNDQEAIDLAIQSEQRAEIARYRTIESRVTETRGIWIRPTETTRETIALTLDQMAEAGYNLVYLETFYQGYTIFPSETAEQYGIPAQRPQFEGIDPLQIWIEEAHARNIELHPWVENFFVGVEQEGGPGPILTVYPEWAAVEWEDVGKEGPQPSAAEPGYYFLDPALPEARQYVLEIYAEMLERYEIDGIHLDYIRYPVSLPRERSFSYSDFSRAAFEEVAGVDPYTINPDDNPEKWEEWIEWRQNNITSFVKEVRDAIDTTRPDAALSAAVFPDEFDSQIRKMQKWPDWVDAGWMDFMAGMSFGRSADSVAADTTAMIDIVDGKTLIYTGVYAPFLSLSPGTLVDQIEAVRGAGAQGVSVFAWGQVSNPFIEAQNEGPYRLTADAPHSDPQAAVLGGVNDLLNRIEDVYKTNDCMIDKTAQPLTIQLDGAVSALENDPNLNIAITRLKLANFVLRIDDGETNKALRSRLRSEVEHYRGILEYTRDRG